VKSRESDEWRVLSADLQPDWPPVAESELFTLHFSLSTWGSAELRVESAE